MPQTISTLNNQAVKASLSQDWQQALSLNQHILQLDNKHIPALNRLARAYEKTGQAQKAKQTYQKVLKIDQYNNIAQTALERLKTHTPKNDTQQQPAKSDRFSFIEQPGKTKTTWLTKTVTKLIPQLDISQRVRLKANKYKISVRDQNNQHLGYLPDDLSAYLIKLIRLGCKFEAAIKKISNQKIQIFIRETRKSKRLRGLPTFSKNDQDHYPTLPSEPLDESPLEIPNPEDPEQRQKVTR